MPTFQFYKGKVKVDEMTGADEKKLEEKIKKWIGDSDNDVGVKGHVSSKGGGVGSAEGIIKGSEVTTMLGSTDVSDVSSKEGWGVLRK